MAHIDLKSGDLGRRIEALERALRRSVLNNASIGRGGLRVHSGGALKIQDGGKFLVEGAETSMEFIPDWQGSGTSARAVLLLRNTAIGTSQVSAGQLRSEVDSVFLISPQLAGAEGQRSQAELNWDKWRLDFPGTSSSSFVYGLSNGNWGIGMGGGGTVSCTAGTPVTVNGGLDVVGAKNFIMPHPTLEGHVLRHGATESPVSGTEYTGAVQLDGNGEAVVTLPTYFEALNKPENRTVQLTPVGRPFPVGSEHVTNGQFTIYGDPGREVFWLVKAERIGGDFITEEPGTITPPAPDAGTI